MIAELIERGLAYEVDGNVYYDVSASRVMASSPASAGAAAGRPPRRRARATSATRRTSRSGRLAEPGRAHEVAVTLGRRLPGLAHRVLGDVA